MTIWITLGVSIFLHYLRCVISLFLEIGLQSQKVNSYVILLAIAEFPLQEIAPVRRSNLPCALSIPASSCWVSQQCKALTALYMSHFSGLCCISPTLQDEVMSSSSQRASLLLFATKALNPVSPVFLFCNATHCVYRHPLSVPMSSLWDLREQETDTVQYDALVTAFAMSNKSFFSGWVVLCLLPATVKK